jgi:2-keto-4-pentenoate hydratase/2-oxohepta-3-ene-1,7-dioic acid hydratase in catechol pathway
MRYLTYQHEGHWRAGLGAAEAVVDASRALADAGLGRQAGADPSTRELLQLPDSERAELQQAVEQRASSGDALAIDEIELGPPIGDPEKIICLGLNYRAHAEEFDAEVPAAPILFPKFRPSLIGPRGTIRIPPATAEVDFEGELAVVIGRPCKNATVTEALDHVAGCMAFNDVTARDLQFQTSQWTAGKAIDTFAPCGPALVTLDELGDITRLRLRTRVNGSQMQEAAAAEMIFTVPEIIAFVSGLVTLVPGDIIATGTPEGVGFRREPPVYLTDGDVVEVEIDSIGTLRNQVAREEPSSGTDEARLSTTSE